jgi:nitrite reductase/ring-hydroxylating ferredoxin subunit
MDQAHRICRVADIPDGGALGVDLETTDGPLALILLRRGAEVFAYHNECPHAGRRLEYAPGKFMVRDGRLMCAVHGATFAVADGACCGGPARSDLVAQPVRIEEGDVLLEAGNRESGIGKG